MNDIWGQCSPMRMSLRKLSPVMTLELLRNLGLYRGVNQSDNIQSFYHNDGKLFPFKFQISFSKWTQWVSCVLSMLAGDRQPGRRGPTTVHDKRLRLRLWDLLWQLTELKVVFWRSHSEVISSAAPCLDVVQVVIIKHSFEDSFGSPGCQFSEEVICPVIDSQRVKADTKFSAVFLLISISSTVTPAGSRREHIPS